MCLSERCGVYCRSNSHCPLTCDDEPIAEWLTARWNRVGPHSELKRGDPNSVEYDLRYEMLGYYIPPQYIPVSRITKPTKVYKANNSIHLRMVQCTQPLIVARLSDKCMSHAKLYGGNVISLGSWKS